MCSLKEGSIISVLSPPPKNQVWDCIGLMESACGHSLGDALGPCPLHRWYCIARDTLDTGRLVPPPEAVVAFFAVTDGLHQPGKCLLVDGDPRTALQLLLGSSRVLEGLRVTVAGHSVLGAFLWGGHGPGIGTGLH